MAKINFKTAKESFENWLDYKRIRGTKKESNKEQADLLIEAIQYGDLIVNEDFTMLYKLLVPIKDDDGADVLTELTFKPRIRKDELIAKYKGLKTNDADGRLLGTIAAICEKNRGLIGKLDTVDMSVCESIALYFL